MKFGQSIMKMKLMKLWIQNLVMVLKCQTMKNKIFL